MVAGTKVCLAVNKFFFGNRGVHPQAGSPLIAEAEAFALRDPDHLKACHFLKSGLGFPMAMTSGPDRALIDKIVESGKPVIFHSGSGFETHLYIVSSIAQKDKIENDRGFLNYFVRLGYPSSLRSVALASFHLWPSSRNVFLDLSTRAWHPDPDEALSESGWLSNLRTYVDMLRYNYSGAIGFENMPFYPHHKDTGDQLCKPQFFGAVFAAVPDAYFLLDLAHAKVSAVNLGYKHPEDYLKKLPLKKVREIHISGTANLKAVEVETHAEPGKGIIELLKWTLRQGVSPDYITVEDYNASPENQLSDIRAMKDLLAKLP